MVAFQFIGSLSRQREVLEASLNIPQASPSLSIRNMALVSRHCFFAFHGYYASLKGMVPNVVHSDVYYDDHRCLPGS